MSDYKPFSIAEEGLKKYLDTTVAEHNDIDHDKFLFYINPSLKVPNTVIGRIMGVSHQTIKNWKKIHRKEQKNVKRKR